MAFLYPEDIFEIPGRGVVLTGISNGVFTVGDALSVVSTACAFEATLQGIESNRELLQASTDGLAIGILIKPPADIDLTTSLFREEIPELNLTLFKFVITNSNAEVEKLKDGIPSAHGLKTNIADNALKSAEPYFEVLSRKYKQLVYVDDYGDKQTGAFNKEVIRFCLAKLNIAENFIPYAASVIASHVESLQSNEKDNTFAPAPSDPYDYERHCAAILSQSGWNARTTKGSGDQGIDVIATFGNTKAVFQCKKYSQPVGNAAVQEIIAGKQFEQAHIAAVVSNAAFTPAARQLAGATGVFLLHHDD